MTMRRILLSGEMATRFGAVHQFDVQSPAEALRALKANFRDFSKYLYECAEKGLGFHVFIGADPISAELLDAPAGRDAIRIVPVVGGAKSGWLPIIAAFALAVATDGFSAPITLGSMSITASTAGMMALSLAISGVSMLLAQMPKLDRNEKAAPPYNFNGPVNTTAQGLPVPVVYGEMIVGSRVISADITVNDIPVPPMWEREL